MRHLTIVYTINDEDAFDEEEKRIKNMISESDGKPFAITAWSQDNEVNRHMLMLECLDRHDRDTLEQLVSADDVGDYATIDEFISANS